MTEAERGGEEADVARIRAKGEEARKQMQAVSLVLVAKVSARVIGWLPLRFRGGCPSWEGNVSAWAKQTLEETDRNTSTSR